MNAQRARDITDKFAENSAEVAELMNVVYGWIKEAAEHGQSSTTYKGYSFNRIVTVEEKAAIFSVLEKNGYTVTHVPNPDPDEPRSHAYYEISW